LDWQPSKQISNPNESPSQRHASLQKHQQFHVAAKNGPASPPLKTPSGLLYSSKASRSPGNLTSKFATTFPSLPTMTLWGMYWMPYSAGAVPAPCVQLPARPCFFTYASASSKEDILTSRKFTLPLYFGLSANCSSCLAAGPHAGQKFW